MGLDQRPLENSAHSIAAEKVSVFSIGHQPDSAPDIEFFQAACPPFRSFKKSRKFLLDSIEDSFNMENIADR